MRKKDKTAKIPVVGITGPPAAGKTTALKVFARAGFVTFSADEYAREVFSRARNLAAVKRIFGAVSRKKVAAAAFRDPRKLRALERIIHPAVISELGAATARARRLRRPFAAEVPLLFEKKLEKMFNTTITITAARTVLLERLRRRGFGAATAAGMLRAHFSVTKKSGLSDITVRNSFSPSVFRSDIKRVAAEVFRTRPSRRKK